MVNIDELMRLSKAAQSRPWKARPEYHSYDGGQEYILYCIENANNTITEVNDEEADAEYICAACNAVPELLQMIKELQRENIILRLQLIREKQEVEERIKNYHNLYKFDIYGRPYLTF